MFIITGYTAVKGIACKKIQVLSEEETISKKVIRLCGWKKTPQINIMVTFTIFYKLNHEKLLLEATKKYCDKTR